MLWGDELDRSHSHNMKGLLQVTVQSHIVGSPNLVFTHSSSKMEGHRDRRRPDLRAPAGLIIYVFLIALRKQLSSKNG